MDNHVDPTSDSLSVESLMHIDRVCVAFEESCKSVRPKSIESFLRDVPETLYSALLRELLSLDVDYRCRHGERPDMADYAERFPNHRAVVADVLERADDNASATPRLSEMTADFSNSPPGSVPISPGETIGRYTVLRELGHGAFGMVYLALDEELQRKVAVKIPCRQRFSSADQLLRFFEEARTAACLKHEGIVPIHDVGRTHDGVPFVVMEYLEGESLETTLRTNRLSFRQIAELMVDVAEAVHYAHRQGVVHRDLKPGNIVFDSRGKACITDFGLAERWESDADVSSTSPPALAGTFQFIPPEVYSGRAAIGPRIDVYALGVILYRALTGRYPFQADNLHDLQDQIRAGFPPLPLEIDPNVPEKLQRICLMAMENHIHRYESAKMLADELRRFLDGREVLARPRRYDVELRGKLQNHYAAIHSWREQELLSLAEMDRLLRPYWFLLQSDSPWTSLARLYPLEAIGIRLGGWLVLLSTLLWAWFYWDDLSPDARIASVGLPTLALNGVGWTLRYLGSTRNARIFLGTGALLLPLLVAIVLSDFHLLHLNQGPQWEVFADLEKEWTPSNLQFTVACAAFLAYCVFLLRHFPGRLFAIWLAIGVYVFYTGCLALCGLKHWLNDDHVARALVCYLLPCLLLLVGSLTWDRRNHRGEAAMLYAFFPAPFVIVMTLLAYHGSIEWLDVEIQSERGFSNETVNQWWMSNGLAYAIAAIICQRAHAGFVRFWSTFFAVLVPISLLLPCNLLFDQGWPLMGQLGQAPLKTYELLGGLTAVVFIVLGTATNRATLSMPGLIGLAVAVFRFTQYHYPQVSPWPIWIALIGGVTMLAGVVSVFVRSRQREGISVRT
jgi:serine/threonine-protein kinase